MRRHHAHAHPLDSADDLSWLAPVARHEGRWVRFDARIALSAVQGATPRYLGVA